MSCLPFLSQLKPNANYTDADLRLHGDHGAMQRTERLADAEAELTVSLAEMSACNSRTSRHFCMPTFKIDVASSGILCMQEMHTDENPLRGGTTSSQTPAAQQDMPQSRLNNMERAERDATAANPKTSPSATPGDSYAALEGGEAKGSGALKNSLVPTEGSKAADLGNANQRPAPEDGYAIDPDDDDINLDGFAFKTTPGGDEDQDGRAAIDDVDSATRKALEHETAVDDVSLTKDPQNFPFPRPFRIPGRGRGNKGSANMKVGTLSDVREAYSEHNRQVKEALTKREPRVTVARVVEVIAGRAATLGVLSALASETVLHQSVLSQLLGRWEGVRQVEAAIPQARSAAGFVFGLMTVFTLAETVFSARPPPRPGFILPPKKQLWIGRAAMAAFAALVLYESIHSNRPLFPFGYLLGH